MGSSTRPPSTALGAMTTCAMPLATAALMPRGVGPRRHLQPGYCSPNAAASRSTSGRCVGVVTIVTRLGDPAGAPAPPLPSLLHAVNTSAAPITSAATRFRRTFAILPPGPKSVLADEGHQSSACRACSSACRADRSTYPSAGVGTVPT